MNLIRSKPWVVGDIMFWPITPCLCDSYVESQPSFWEEVARDDEPFIEVRRGWGHAHGALIDSLWMNEKSLSGNSCGFVGRFVQVRHDTCSKAAEVAKIE